MRYLILIIHLTLSWRRETDILDIYVATEFEMKNLLSKKSALRGACVNKTNLFLPWNSVADSFRVLVTTGWVLLTEHISARSQPDPIIKSVWKILQIPYEIVV